MDALLIVLSSTLIVAGIVGCFLPVIPGPPLSFAGLLLLQLSSYSPFSLNFFIFYGLLTILATVLDYFVPSWGVKKLGGAKAAIWGSAIGAIAGIFIFPPVGLIIGPFAGAIIGELAAGNNFKKSVKIGLGALLGLAAGILIKLIASLLMAYEFVKALI